MTWPQIVTGSLLVVLLIAVAGFFLGRQVQAWRELRQCPPETEEEERHLRRRTIRRLLCSTLLLILGFMLAVALLFLEERAQQVADLQDALRAKGQNTELTDADRNFSRLYGCFWLAFLLILMTIVFLMAFDLWATRWHALREHRRIQADRRRMLEQQLIRLRHERHDPG